MSIEETHYGICFQCDKSSHLGKNLLLPELLGGLLYELDMQDPQKSDCWTFQNMRWLFMISASQRKLPDILQDTEEVTDKLPI